MYPLNQNVLGADVCAAIYTPNVLKRAPITLSQSLWEVTKLDLGQRDFPKHIKTTVWVEKGNYDAFEGP